ncbi:MAG: YdhR family protein [Rhodobacteraceae bacterium]|nr:YdhR family protein [Paracoccaceae bacterium]
MVILQINYRRPDIPAAEWDARYTDEIAGPFIEMPGLKWKIWIDEPEAQLSGGIYLFETRADAEAYLAGPIVTRMKENPALSEKSFQIFEIRDRVSELTRAPLD